MRMGNIIIFLGMPGSGKGTHAKNFADTFGYTHLSTGDILREEVSAGSEKGKIIDQIINKGDFIPDDMICNILVDKLNINQNYILDGFPRSMMQALFLEDFIKKHTGYRITKVLYLDLPLNVAQERLLSRGRKDDTAETIKRRFEVYAKETKPLIDFYIASGLLLKISTDGTKEIVFNNILKSLNFSNVK